MQIFEKFYLAGRKRVKRKRFIPDHAGAANICEKALDSQSRQTAYFCKIKFKNNRTNLMRNKRFFCVSLSLFLVVALLTSRIGSYTRELFVGPIQDHISNVATVCADDDPLSNKSYIFKIKRVLFEVASPALDQVVIVFILPSSFDQQFVSQRFTMPSDVYLDILVPPDEYAPFTS